MTAIRSLVGVGTGLCQPAPIQSLYLLQTIARGPTSIDFGENQLSPGLIGLSPLPTRHPNGFQPVPVRASTQCYLSFTLHMGRSPWLRVYPLELQLALVTGLAFAVAPCPRHLAALQRRNSPDHNAKGTQSAVPGFPGQPPTACKRMVSGSLSLPALGCFSPVPHGTRSLSVTQESLALEGGPPRFTLGSSAPECYSGTLLPCRLGLRIPGFHRLWRNFPEDFRCRSDKACAGPTTPIPQRRSVWALSVSLAATWDISIDFSFLPVLRCFSSQGSLSIKE